jgi:hypothetical protein
VDDPVDGVITFFDKTAEALVCSSFRASVTVLPETLESFVTWEDEILAEPVNTPCPSVVMIKLEPLIIDSLKLFPSE